MEATLTGKDTRHALFQLIDKHQETPLLDKVIKLDSVKKGASLVRPILRSGVMHQSSEGPKLGLLGIKGF